MSKLPRLLYIGDVPVESSYHGSALLFRLFQNWPPEALRIVESSVLPSRPERRVSGVHYDLLQTGWHRPLYTRFARWYSVWLAWSAVYRVRRLTSLLGNFEPQAIVTATHGFSWLTAGAFARQRGLPLHLICHDDLPRVGLVAKPFASWFDRQFGRVYRSAASRLCVSPFMREAYLKRYGCEGTVLYPSRGADCPEFDGPPGRLSRNDHPFTVAFAGNINSSGYTRALKALAMVLEPLGGRLMIFGPLTEEAAQQSGLARPNVTLCGLVASNELIASLRAEADALFVPMSFSSEDHANMEISFPSKLADYTAVGLPLVVYGPAYCSAVRWAHEHCGIAEVIDEDTPEALTKAIINLANDEPRRMQLGQAALEAGRKMFGHSSIWTVFRTALSNAKR